MAFFSGSKAYLDFSYDLRDKRDWNVALIRELEYLPDISALAVDATNGLLAVGSKRGKVLVFGTPAATVVLRISRAVKFLSFAALVFKLVCVDGDGMIHVWDLGQLGRPRLSTSEAYRESISCIATSPYHSHVFIGLERGIVLTYDLLCLNRSPYVIPNVWKSHRKDMIHGDISSSPANSTELMDITVHPRDLNLMFISYGGGVVLYDLTDRRPLHVYELVIPPGAPGAFGYYDPDVLKPRHPLLTSIAVHASGQLFVTGHIDGTIAFWAVDDEDRPLMVRTSDKIDINYPEGEELDVALSNPQRPSVEELANYRLEPVFKLSWSLFGPQTVSDPYNGDSVLTILGGLLPNQGSGVTILRFPSLTLPSPSTPARDSINPEIRKTLTKWLSFIERYLYSTAGATHDFLLIPGENPHFAGNLDPKAIITLSEWPEGQRTVDARAFPPPGFGIGRETKSVQTPTKEPEDPQGVESTDALKSLNLNCDPADYTHSLPSAFWTGMYVACGGDIVRLENEEYELLLRGYELSSSSIFAQIGRDKVAGVAWVDYGDHNQAQNIMSTKRQPHRLLVTYHRDLTVRFQDITPELLVGSKSSRLPTPFPAPLPHLMISLSDLLSEPCIVNALKPLALEQAEIQSARLTNESCECCIVMKSGHVFIFGFDGRQRRGSQFRELQDSLVRLTHIPAMANTFQPTLMIENVRGCVTAAEMSDIGFLAIAYDSGALVVVDMRYPTVIFQDGDLNTKKRLSVALHLHNAANQKQIVAMKWVVCGYDEDITPRVRLLASQRSGDVRVLTLTQSASREWLVEEDVKTVDGLENPLPRGMFVLQAKTGSSRAASRATFQEALQGGVDPILAKGGDDKDDGAHCFWVSASEKGAKCQVNISGGRAGKTDWPKERKVEYVQVVSRNGRYSLVAVMDTREVFAYSLPALEPMHIYQLPKQPRTVISFEDTGDFVDWVIDEQTETIIGATLGTLFAIRRVFDEPIVDFTSGRRTAPSMPPPVPLAPINYLGSWFNFKKSKSGDAIDDLLAGANRPIPEDAETSTIVNGEWQAQVQTRAQTIANQASQAGSNLYSNLSAAVSERGEMLGGIQEQFSTLENSGKKMVEEAKKLAAQQTAKGWFNF